MVGMAGISGRMSPRSKMGQKWLSKIKKGALIHPKKASIAGFSNIHMSPLGSQMSFTGVQKIETVVDWDSIRKKYLALFSIEPEGNLERDEKDLDENEEETGGAAAPTPNANVV